MKDCTITAKSSITRSLGPLILGNIYGPFMKVCNIHAISANISQLGGIILENIYGQFIKVSVIHAISASTRQLVPNILGNIYTIQSIHEGFRHVCNQCDYKSTGFILGIQSKCS